MFARTIAINKLLGLRKRKKVIQGGTWAGKTFGIIAVMINYAASNPGHDITVVAETMPALKSGAIKQFKEIMQETGRWVESRWHGTDFSYTFANKARIEFKSFDSVGKAKAAGKRKVLFINEANHISFEIADTLMTRTEGDIWIDFNPDEAFWVHNEILPQADAEFLLLKYTDNSACPETIKQDLFQKQGKANAEKAKGLPITSYWQNWCRVYIDGEIGSLQGTIFNNWSLCEIVPPSIPFLAYGHDFGFTNDPTANIAVYREGQKLWLKQILYQTSLTNGDVIGKFPSLGVLPHQSIVADSAEPKSIEDFRRAGYAMEPANKGADSIRNSISTLQDFEIFVTDDSLDLIKELRTYRWQVDRNGKITNDPIDSMNHGIDAVRYVALNKINKEGLFAVY